MKQIHSILLLVLLVAMPLSGCMTRQILTADDHPSLPATLVVTHDKNNFVLFSSTHRRYWECRDDGENLVCTRACDTPESGAQCPSSFQPGW